MKIMRKFKRKIDRNAKNRAVKQAGRKLVAATLLGLSLSTLHYGAVYAATQTGETPDKPNVGTSGFTINDGETKSTWSRTTESNGSYNGLITLGNGAVWRPLNSSLVNAKLVTLGNNSVIDLAYKYTSTNWAGADSIDWSLSDSYRKITFTTVDVGNNVNITLNAGGASDTARSDSVTFSNWEKITLPTDGANINFEVNYQPGFGGVDWDTVNNGYLRDNFTVATITGAGSYSYVTNHDENFITDVTTAIDAFRAQSPENDALMVDLLLHNSFDTVCVEFMEKYASEGTLKERYTDLVNEFNQGFTNLDQKLTFTKTDGSTSQTLLDGRFKKYSITSWLTESSSISNYTASLTEYLNWEARRTELLNQAVYSAANAQLAMRNLWRMEDNLLWRRGEDLRSVRLQNDDGQNREGAWGNIWRGKYTYDGVQGSSFNQNYSGIAVGYDKKREGDLNGGKLYTGIFLNLLDSKADVAGQTLSAAGDEAFYSSSGSKLTSKGVGVYSSWVGNNGAYADALIRGSKLGNTYHYINPMGTRYDNEFGTWTYGVALRTGIQKKMNNGWFYEPQAGLSWGNMKGYTYDELSDDTTMGLRYKQDNSRFLIGRLGITVGQQNDKNLIYAKAAVNHDFLDAGDGSVESIAKINGAYSAQERYALNALANKDTWVEFTLGSKFKLSDNNNAFLELNKTVGGEVNTKWQIQAGINGYWGGSSKTVSKRVQNQFAEDDLRLGLQESLPADLSAVKADGGSEPEHVSDADGQKKRFTVQAGTGNNGVEGSVGDAGLTDGSSPLQQNANTAISRDSEVNDSSYTFAPLVVEAARPDWEKKLSPGTVSVIHVPEYKGEMKNLPDLLQTVPGVYVQRLQGTGHYTVARVRGSTGGEVNIYVDGVLVNSQADAAVDLSTIPVENVERIEVYRGYVPARFAGSPLGGAINIVTKKPTETTGSITTGLRSFNGYTGNLELTAPVGDGSLLFALNRDQAKGDFKYDHFSSSVLDAATREPLKATRHRLNNDYQNTDALLKWQDDNWFAKLTYKKNTTSLPESAMDRWADAPYKEVLDYYGDLLSPDWKQYRERQIDTTKTEFLLGQRQTAGNLEWGWKMNTSYQLKQASSSQYKAANGNYFLTLDNEFRNRRYEGALDGSWKLGKNHLVEFLFDYAKETMDVSISNPKAWPPDVSAVTGDMANYKKYFVPHYDNDNYYFQVQDTMTLNKSGNLFFTPQLKAQKWDMSTLDQLGDPDIGRWLYSYGLGLKKVQNEHWTFRGTYGTYYKLPNFYELFGDGVNVKSRWETYRSGYTQYERNSVIERGTSWDVSANWQGKALAADSDVTLTYFNRNAKNLSTYAIDFYGFGYYTNLAAGKIQGVELESRLKWRRWDLLLAATWNDSLVLKSGRDNMVTKSDVNAGNPFPWIPEWEYNVRLGYRFPGDKLSAFAEYHYLDKVGTAIDSVDASKIAWWRAEKYYESLGLTNIGLKYDFNKKVKLTAGINDLFNKGPEQLYHFYSKDSVGHARTEYGNIQYPQQGRTYYMTAQYFF